MKLKLLLLPLVFALASHGVCFALPETETCCKNKTEVVASDCHHQEQQSKPVLSCCSIQPPVTVQADNQQFTFIEDFVYSNASPQDLLISLVSSEVQSLRSQGYIKNQSNRYLELGVLLN